MLNIIIEEYLITFADKSRSRYTTDKDGICAYFYMNKFRYDLLLKTIHNQWPAKK